MDQGILEDAMSCSLCLFGRESHWQLVKLLELDLISMWEPD